MTLPQLGTDNKVDDRVASLARVVGCTYCTLAQLGSQRYSTVHSVLRYKKVNSGINRIRKCI